MGHPAAAGSHLKTPSNIQWCISLNKSLSKSWIQAAAAVAAAAAAAAAAAVAAAAVLSSLEKIGNDA